MIAHQLKDIATPAFVLDEARLKANMARAARLRAEGGCKVLLATKAFALPAAFPLMIPHLDGTTASGLYEARLGHAEFGKEVHVYSPAFTPPEVAEVLPLASHIYFNSGAQLAAFAPMARGMGKDVGIRVNPGFSRAAVGGDLYDPCAPTSRFGVTADKLGALPWDDIDVFHVHALCEGRHADSQGLIEHVTRSFAPFIARVKTVNFGGGHFINDAGYDLDTLIGAVRDFKSAFPHVGVTLEPGGGLVRGAGYYATRVMDIVENGANRIAVIDGSICNHLPDVLEVPYTPKIEGAGAGPHTYLIGGNTCMTGDLVGEAYAFEKPLKPGDMLVMGDMMQYSFVKTNTFNGIRLPDLGILSEDGTYRVIKSFGYEDFRSRLG